jgi:hypothetical protein
MGEGVDRHHRQGSPSVKGIHQDGECGVDAAHGLHVLRWRPSDGLAGGPSSSDVLLESGEHAADPALRVLDWVARWIWGLMVECAAWQRRGDTW